VITLDIRSLVFAGLIVSTANALRPDRSVPNGTASQAPPATVAFSKDIAPILYEHCAACHHPGGWAPFSLLAYDDVRPRARQIANVVRRRLMPPWKPESDHGGPFVGERRLTDAQIELIQEWVAEGATAGASADLPQMPVFEDGNWQLGVPDLVITMPRRYTLPAGDRDVFRNFVMPIPISETRYVKGLEFQPGNRSVAHHATMRIDQTSASRRLDERDPEPGYSGVTAPSALYPDGHSLAWTPGQVPPFLPAGMSWRLEPGSNLVVQMHMVQTRRVASVSTDDPDSIQIRVGFYFADKPPDRTPTTLRLGRHDIDIQPGESDYVVSDSYVLPVDVEVHSVQPHAHYLAKEIKGLATLPDGTRRWLIYIKDWDFHWQDVYRYRDPFWLPKGTTLQMEYSYDNSANNPHNPHSPPKRVRYGEQTNDEMGILWIQVRPHDRKDLAILMRDYQPKKSAEDAVGYQTMLAATPDDASLHDGLAHSYIELGRVAEAISHARESVRLQPASTDAYYNLATVLTASGQFDEAADSFRKALQLNRADTYAHNSLGALLFTMGRPAAALDEFREAVRIDPLYANARNNLGVTLQKLGRIDEAVAEFRQAMRIVPDHPDLHYNLADALRLRGQLDDAISAYLRALTLNPDHERACFQLATVFEARARYPEALDYYHRALVLKPDEPSTMTRLAWILATVPDTAVRNPGEAVTLAKRALAQAGRDEPVILDTLAAAYAAGGLFDLAVADAERALAGLAAEPMAGALAAEIRNRLALYREHKPYRAPATR
jgi:tetratricopeptide (TPR) repeat protein/mono/diheme cytochrome c family protein